jgi:hypothetical protein
MYNLTTLPSTNLSDLFYKIFLYQNIYYYIDTLKGEFVGFFYFYVSYSTLLHLPPLRFNCVGGCWDRTQDCRDFGIDSQTL